MGDSIYSSQGVRRHKGEKGTESEEIGEGAEKQIAAFPTIPSASKRFPFITAPAYSKKTHPVEGCRSADVFITLVLIICLTQQSLTSTPLI